MNTKILLTPLLSALTSAH